MAEAISVSGAFTRAEGKDATFETGLLAPLAGGAVTVQMGDTVVLVTATGAKTPREGADFFPLTVDVEERMYAAGRIPGSFFRREARAGEQAILTCRLIDRPLRPSFPAGYRNEVHVVATVLGADQSNPYDIAALNAASLALCISPVPFDGPIGAVRLAWSSSGEWVPFPTYEEGEGSAFEMVVAGRLAGDDVAVMMVEAGGTSTTWELYADGTPKVDEDVLAGGLEAAKTWIREMIELQQQLIDAVGTVDKMDPPLVVDHSAEILDAVREGALDRIAATQQIADKAERQGAEAALAAEVIAEMEARFGDDPAVAKQVKSAIRAVTKEVVRRRIVSEGIRIDGRATNQLRPLTSRVGVIPTAHGSGLFQRGDTQVLNFTTLGIGRSDMLIDDLSPTEKKRYFHHYNFPPFCTGETGFMRGPKRREIGHGALAERAVFPVVPGFEDWPYTVRTVSEVLASNGSSSMASVCGSTLSLMDAGVPIKAPVAGVAMGLVHADDAWVTLTDILGAEDAFGDMDFKVAGTTDFITALQLDTKIAGIPASVLADALRQAREARLDILDVMAETIMEPRPDVRDTAPKIVTFEIPVEKIGEVIGPKGKVINAIQSETGADISVDDDGAVGIVAVASTDRGAVLEAERQIKLILDPPTADVGATYRGRVVNITKFGAFVNILPGRDGLVHISKLGGGRRIDRVEDVLELGEEIEVVVEDVDPNGKISLIPKTDDTDGAAAFSARAEPRRDGGGRPERRRGPEGGDTDRSPGRSDRNGGRGERAGSDFRRSNDGRGDRRDSEPRRDGRGGGRGREAAPVPGARRVSFEDSFDRELEKDFGDLGPDPRARRTGRRNPRGPR
ncbi:MAG: polyribonucleotide nucleotidyltransferase [Acidimicrobiaceae bacterium]|nr:polyribonucleotide nucleotidyltransferase [Acidimicrobiaceae bacterium]